MLSRNELLAALRAQRARRDELLGVDAQQWAWHCGACYAIAAALGIDPNGPIPDDEPEPVPEPEPELDPSDDASDDPPVVCGVVVPSRVVVEVDGDEADAHELAAALGLTREDYEILPDPDASTLSGG